MQSAADSIQISIHGLWRVLKKTVHIEFQYAPSPLGVLLLARVEVGFLTLLFADELDEALTLLRQRFPSHSISLSTDDWSRIWQVLDAYWQDADSLTPSVLSALPLAPQGSEFQQAVWSALQQIPVGQTASYQQIAQSIARPTASRAVAAACAANPLALFIPCHRVIRQTGALSGYRWGVSRKRALLAHEAGQSLSSLQAEE